MLHLFPTSRMVRDFYASYEGDGFLPQALSVANFESKVVLVDGLKLALEDRRVLIMQEACRFENFKKLHIPDEFLAFLKNSSYLFRFFEELAVEKKSINELKNADVYAQFNEHLEILNELHARYTSLLKQKGYYDSITLPTIYEINTDYLKRFDKILLHVEGFLNRFEWDLFRQISKIVPVEIFLHVNKYNQKMRDIFLHVNINIPKNGNFKINLNEKTFEPLKSEEKAPVITHKSFSIRSLQIGYIYEQIENFINDGLNAEEIVVILPDEGLAPLLKAYDRANNLNFAMGFSFTQTKIYKTLSVIEEAICELSPQNRESLKYFELEEKIDNFKNIWNKEISFEDFKNLLDSLEFEFSSQTKTVFQNELYHIGVILKQINLKLSQVFKLFLQRLSKVSIDDTSGGRVVVMGVLETRGVKFNGVIIPDFNDEFIPRFSQKDMFLSSRLRQHANLPSLKDRENLQRYYYHRIIHNAQKVALCYVQNDTSLVSRSLQNLNSFEDTRYSQDSYATLLFDKKEAKPVFVKKNLIEPNSILNKPLSSSRLKYFLTCKRGYYHRYIQKIKEDDIPNDDLGPQDTGNFLHESLHEVYQNPSFFKDAKTLHNALCEALNEKHHPKALWLLEREVWQKRLFIYCQNEIKRFEDGWKPFEFEKNLDCEFNGVKLYGIIDRIDVHEDGSFCVIDYKSGKINMEKKIENMVDFQLQFYFILSQNRYKNVKNAGFYDLLGGKIVWEESMQQKCDRLGEILEDIKKQDRIDFAIEDKDCAYSPYNILLGRE